MKNKTDYSNTIIVKCDTKGLQYDIHGLLKAFWPSKDVRVLEPGDAVHDESIYDEEPYMTVEYINNSVTIHGDDGRYEFDIDEELGKKNSFKRFLYELLSNKTNQKLPWGNLTGVRPTKIAMTMINDGKSDADIRDFLLEKHCVSKQKTELSLDIAHRELDLIKKLDIQKGYSLYIGIPFCPTTCLYCSFTSFPISAWRNRVDEYLDAVRLELEYVNRHFQGKSPDTLYIGGGTPTSLDEEHLEKLFKIIVDTVNLQNTIEFTCEAGRPDSITEEKLRIMNKYGVTRMSVNPQTMQQKTLDIIGRRTTVEQLRTSFYSARKVGFNNINMDIILGLPGENEEDVADTLEQIKEMGPDSLTVHSLAIKRASRLKQHLDEIGIDAMKNTDETMQMAADAAKQMEMVPYYLYRQKNMSGNFENTGFSVPGKEGIYNILIMEEVQTIVACGAGTVTKRVYGDGRIERCDNVKDVELYISKIEEMIDRKRALFAD